MIKKINITHLFLVLVTLTGISNLQAAEYLKLNSNDPASIQVDKLTVIDSIGNHFIDSLQLKATDTQDLHVGQVYNVSNLTQTSPGSEDGSYLLSNNTLVIPQLVQDQQHSFNVTLMLTNTDTPELTVTGLGITGQQGPKGDTGATGPAGAQGPIGLTGAKGDTGLQGPKGLTGDSGAKGDKGDTGSQGPIGQTGANGDTGSQGSIGLTGAKGDKGDTGSFPAGSIAGDMQYWDGSQWVPIAAAPATTNPVLYFCSDVPPKPQWQPCKTYAIGDTGPSGGIVFYVDGSGAHGLEAWGSDDLPPTWANALTEASSHGLGWHLPNKNELDLMYQNIGRGSVTNVGGFVINGFYWSSTEYDTTYAWYQDFGNGTQNHLNKINPIAGRAVRAF